MGVSIPDKIDPPVAFAATREYLVSHCGVTRGWRVDGKLLATMHVQRRRPFSNDGKWIAAGPRNAFWGDVLVWDAKIYKEIFPTDQIPTATQKSVRVYDSNDVACQCSMLMDIPVPSHHTVPLVQQRPLRHSGQQNNASNRVNNPGT